MSNIGVGIIGCGGIALQNHLPGLELCADTKLVGLCDNSDEVLDKAVKQTGVGVYTTDYKNLVQRDDIHAVIIATPNVTHSPMAIEASLTVSMCFVKNLLEWIKKRLFKCLIALEKIKFVT